MKIVNRKTFLGMPAGTIYCKYDPQILGDLMMKGVTTRLFNTKSSGDFNCLHLTKEVKCHLGPDISDILEHAEKNGSSFGLDFECYGRDGMLDSDQLFAVWERNDIEGLINKLHEALEDLPDPMKIPMTLFPLEINPFEVYPEFKNILPHRENAPEQDVINYLANPGTERKFLIVVENSVVGITGLWELGNNKIAMAWHVIIPSQRKKGYSEAAIRHLITLCPQIYPKAKMIIECIPEDREDELRGFFQKLGFVKTGYTVDHPELYDKVIWQEYVYDL